MIQKPPQNKASVSTSLWGRILDRIHQNQIVIAALIFLLAVFIYCCATRYTSFRGGGVLDHWTGKVIDPD